MEKRFLETGKIVSVHGLKGEIKVYPWSDGPEYLLDFPVLYLDKGERALKIERGRVQKNVTVLKFEGIDTVEEAMKLRGKVLYLDRQDANLAPGEYFIQDLIGLEVVDADSGERYGTLCEVSPTGANEVYHIRFEDGKERLIPAIKQVVIETDLAKNQMRIRPLKGLFDDED